MTSAGDDTQYSLRIVGSTPVVRLQRIVDADCADVYVKLEYFNPTGSYKDRMALAMIEEAERRGELRPGMTVVEYTGGSTGSSLAFVCAVKGYRFHVVSSDAYAPEKLNTMLAFGANLEIVPSTSGRITPDLIPRLVARASEIAREPNAYFTDQFNNRDSLVGYAAIGRELLSQVPQRVNAFCGGVGTAGMLMGVAGVLRFKDATTRIVALEPASSPAITTGQPGSHHVEGLGVGFVPPLLDRTLYDEARAIAETEARAMCRRLAKEEGIFAGTSTGLNVVGALQLAKEFGPGHTIVTVACDSGLKYLSGDLYSSIAL
ncbi:MAG TPA: cysteine synthase family protein [Steroidobacteraceae bacterium]|nr:cysteine synthase family protein [Steroidobacteraceae bacterium]